MEGILTANDNKIDAVLSENDGMAGGVIAALKAQGLAGKVPVSGQDGDQAALNNVALGNQTVDVWKDARELGKAAGEAALQLCKDKDVTKVAVTAPFTTPGEQHRDVEPAQAAADHRRTTSGRSSTPAGSPRTPCARTSGRVRRRLRLTLYRKLAAPCPAVPPRGRARSYSEPASEAP